MTLFHQVRFIALVAILCAVGMQFDSVQAQTVGYLYPAGGQRGTTFEMLIAGSGLSNAKQVLITGKGVELEIFERPKYGNFEHNNPYGGKCARVWNQIFEEESKLLPLQNDPEKQQEARRAFRVNRHNLTEAIPIKLNDIPTPNDDEVFASSVYFHRLAHPSIRDLQLIFYEYDGSTIQSYKKRHSSFNSTLMVRVKIAPDAPCGVRELYVHTPNGISRAIRFWVTNSTEVVEIEPNEGDTWPRWESRFKTYIELPAQKLPVVINGQIKPGDIDRFHFQGKKGQQVVFDLQSRSTAPFIANAVPGWFTAVMTLFAPNGRKIMYGESYRFDQNPLMTCTLPENGTYMIEIQDSIYRGRNDFVYRLSIGEFPYVDYLFPLGGSANTQTAIQLSGHNLPISSISPDCSGEIFYHEVRSIPSLDKKPLIRPVSYVVESLPIHKDPIDQPNDSKSSEKKERANVPPKTVPPISTNVPFPVVIYGRIQLPNHVNSYRFQGKTGQEIALDVMAQTLGSALDAAIELVDPNGKIVAHNDDRADSSGPNIGEEVCHSDPNLMFKLNQDGTWTVRIYSTLRRGGPEYFYRLRISKPQPDFDVCVIPSRIRFSGKKASFKVKVFRKEGFDGELNLRCIEHCKDMKLANNGKIPAGKNETSFSVSTEKFPKNNPFELKMIAEAKINDKILSHPVLPVDDWEQAFIYHHLVPMNKLMANH